MNISLRKIIKNRGVFPNNEAVPKLFYLALIDISQMDDPIQNWKAALKRFTLCSRRGCLSDNVSSVYANFRPLKLLLDLSNCRALAIRLLLSNSVWLIPNVTNIKR